MVEWERLVQWGVMMSRSTVTVDLSPDVYTQLLERARQHQRQVEEEAGLTLAAAVRTPSVLPDDLEATLDTLDDDTLRRVSYSQPSSAECGRWHPPRRPCRETSARWAEAQRTEPEPLTRAIS